MVADALINGQELVYKAHRGSDGSLKGAMILQVEKRDGETHLLHREPLVMMEKLQGKIKMIQNWKAKKAGECMDTRYRLDTDLDQNKYGGEGTVPATLLGNNHH